MILNLVEALTWEILEDFSKKKQEWLSGILIVKKGLCACFCYFQIKGKNPQNPSLFSSGQAALRVYTEDLRSSERQCRTVTQRRQATNYINLISQSELELF